MHSLLSLIQQSTNRKKKRLYIVQPFQKLIKKQNEIENLENVDHTRRHENVCQFFCVSATRTLFRSVYIHMQPWLGSCNSNTEGLPSSLINPYPESLIILLILIYKQCPKSLISTYTHYSTFFFIHTPYQISTHIYYVHRSLCHSPSRSHCLQTKRSQKQVR